MRVKGGNLISVLIKPNLFWRVTETAPCHYADLQARGEEKGPSLRPSEGINEAEICRLGSGGSTRKENVRLEMGNN